MKMLGLSLFKLLSLMFLSLNANETEAQGDTTNWIFQSGMLALQQKDWFAYGRKSDGHKSSSPVEYLDLNVKREDDLYFAFYVNSIEMLVRLSLYKRGNDFYIQPVYEKHNNPLSNSKLILDRSKMPFRLAEPADDPSVSIFQRHGNEMKTIRFSAFWPLADLTGIAIGVNKKVSDAGIATFYIYFRDPDTEEVHALEFPEMNIFALNPLEYPKEKLKGMIIRLHWDLKEDG